MVRCRRGAGEMRERSVVVLLLLAIVAAYLPSLGGGWVWDDWRLLGANPALTDLKALLTKDVWSPSGGADSDLYRPLTMLSHALVQAVLEGPLLERIVNLALHLLATLLAFSLGRSWGASPEAAAFGAACFALHPGASEAVAWITGRHDLLPATLCLAGWFAAMRGKEWVSGALVGLAVWCKEPYILGPLCIVITGLGDKRVRWRALLISSLMVAAYLAVRRQIALPLPVGAAGANPLGPLGGIASRGVTLLVDLSSPDVCAPFHSRPEVGVVFVVLWLCLLVGAWGRPPLAAVAAAVTLLIPTGPASAQIGMIGDRYYYLPLAALGSAMAVGLSSMLERRPMKVLYAIPVLLTGFTFMRTPAWNSDVEIFGRSIARDPTNPYAAFHLGHAYQVYEGDCGRAIPLYKMALQVDSRAVTNLQACLLQVGRAEEAATLGPQATAAQPDNPRPFRNTARAFAALGRPEEALPWALRGAELASNDAASWVLVGQVSGQVGKLEDAVGAFERALSLDPDSADAKAGLARAKSLLHTKSLGQIEPGESP